MKPSRQWYKNTVLLLMLLSFVSLACTGILKFRKLMSLFSIEQGSLPMDKISTIHDLSGLLFSHVKSCFIDS